MMAQFTQHFTEKKMPFSEFFDEIPSDSSGAILSECKTYRHRLWRIWDSSKPIAGFIMLNPSTADEINNDPTIRKCISYAKREGCGGFIVVNLFQLRSKDPSDLLKYPDPIGPEADSHILEAASLVTGPLIAAWGSKGGKRGEYIAAMFGKNLVCLGKNKNGSPKHPLYLKSETPLISLFEDS